MAAQAVGAVSSRGLGWLLCGAVDQDAGVDLAGAASQVPCSEAQLVDAVGKLGGVDVADPEGRVGEGGG